LSGKQRIGTTRLLSQPHPQIIEAKAQSTCSSATQRKTQGRSTAPRKTQCAYSARSPHTLATSADATDATGSSDLPHSSLNQYEEAAFDSEAAGSQSSSFVEPFGSLRPNAARNIGCT
jgi:hypothetical protein